MENMSVEDQYKMGKTKQDENFNCDSVNKFIFKLHAYLT